MSLRANICGPCTACCTLLGVTELNKPVNETCQFVRIISPTQPATGCSCYKTRPLSCKNFACFFIQYTHKLPLSLRPDKCGFVISEPPHERFFQVHVDPERPDSIWTEEAQKLLKQLNMLKPLLILCGTGRKVILAEGQQMADVMEPSNSAVGHLLEVDKVKGAKVVEFDTQGW